MAAFFSLNRFSIRLIGDKLGVVKKQRFVKYTFAFGDIEASYKTFSLTRHRLDAEELQVQLTYRASPKHVLSYASRNFRLVGLIQL